MPKRYVVKLSEDERDALEQICKKGRVAAQRRRHAGILLLADEGEHGPSMTDVEVAERIEVTTRCVAKVRERCVDEGLEVALQRKKRSRERTAKLDGDAEARLVSLACSDAPEGQARWTLKLLTERLVELEIVESVACETVRQVLKKHNKTLAETNVVYCAKRGWGVRLSDGGSAGCL